MKAFSILVVLFLSLAVIAKKTKKVEIAKGLKAYQYMNVFFSGQPNEANYAELKKAGFASVINLRQENEGTYMEADEEKAVLKLDMNYTHIPMSGKDQLDNEMVDRISRALKKHRKEGKTLIHCGSGGRVALWLGGHFFRDHKFSKKEAMRLAQDLGLSSPAHQKNLKRYLDAQ